MIVPGIISKIDTHISSSKQLVLRKSMDVHGLGCNVSLTRRFMEASTITFNVSCRRLPMQIMSHFSCIGMNLDPRLRC